MEPDLLRNAFDTKAQAWDDYTRTPIGRLREELTLRYLSLHLPDASRAPIVLDAGGGTGGLSIALARRGFRVHLVDLAPAMLDVARSRARQDDPIEYHCASIEDADRLFAPGSFDLVVCHTLIEYVPNPDLAIRPLAHLLKPGGTFSLEYVNRHADVLRLALVRAHLSDARAALDGGTSQADLFGVPRRTFDRDEARSMLRAAGVEPIAEYGVRVFADYIVDARWQTDAAAYADLVALEDLCAAREPYRSIARYGLIIGKTKLNPALPTSTPNTGSGRREFWI